jgi:hypothetical protein
MGKTCLAPADNPTIARANVHRPKPPRSVARTSASAAPSIHAKANASSIGLTCCSHTWPAAKVAALARVAPANPSAGVSSSKSRTIETTPLRIDTALSAATGSPNTT